MCIRDSINSIIIMALLISVIVTIITVYNGFISTDKNRINLLKSFSATKGQIFKYVILPSSYSTIISSLKINISMTLIGVIMGEFLVSKSGIGYLINYGSQVFNLNLVISGTVSYTHLDVYKRQPLDILFVFLLFYYYYLIN